MLVGYTTLMAPEAMGFQYLETLASWAKICDKIAICYSRFPKLDLPIPDGAQAPWEDDGTLDILSKFDEEVLGDKLIVIEHEWNPDYPREDGKTKQLARELALSHCGKNPRAWVAQFDGDETLRDEDGPRILEFLEEHQNNQQMNYACAGILEMFGGIDKVRFGFGNWVKIRLTRATSDIVHDMPLWARDRNPRTGHIIAKDNKDDGAGMVFKYAMNRPDYNTGGWLFEPKVIMAGNAFAQGRVPPQQAKGLLEADLQQGVWMFHTSWTDIAKKWRMGWYFDNFWSVLNGVQDTFTEKAELHGEFTHTRMPSEEELEAELKKEMQHPGIISIKNEWPSVFEQVKQWRKNTNKNSDC